MNPQVIGEVVSSSGLLGGAMWLLVVGAAAAAVLAVVWESACPEPVESERSSLRARILQQAARSVLRQDES